MQYDPSALIASIQDLVALHAPDGTYLWVSPSCRELLGYEPDELLGTNPYLLFHPEDQEAIRAQSHEPAINGDDSRLSEYRIRRKDGAYVWFETRTRPISDNGEGVRLQTTSRDVTQRRRATAELHASQELLNSVLSSSVDGVMAFDAVRDGEGAIVDFTFRLVNLAAEAVVGRTSAHLVGKRLLEELPGNKEAGLFDIYRVVVETGEPASREFFYDHDGIRAWFQNTAVKRGDGFAVTFRDVTEQKEREAALRESEDRFRTAFEDAAVGKALVSTEGRFIRANPALCALVGYDEAEFVQKTFQEITHPDDLDADLAYVQQMLDGEIATYEMEKRYLHRNGHVVWVLLSVSRLLDEAGAVRYFIVEIQDITERKWKERALQQSEDNLALAQRIAQLGSWEWDLQTGERSWSDELFRLYGLDPAAPPSDLAAAFTEGAHPDDRAGLEAELAALCQADEVVPRNAFEYRILRPDGTTCPVRCIGRIGRDPQSGALRAIGTVQDITEEKRNEQLRTNFISVVSHELRTPLTSIAGSLRLIASQTAGAVPAPVQGMLDIAQRNSDRLVRLINDILDVQKMEAGEMRLHRTPRRLGGLLAAAVEANAGYGQERRVTIALGPVPDAEVEVDTDRFAQVMANLLSNAIKFSPDGGEVEVTATTTPHGVRIAVADRGPGIPVAFHDRVFERFAQADSSTTRKKEGSGLGLSITKSLVELHGGQIGFDSAPGVGSTFYVDLPARSLSAASPPETPPEPPRLLIVEDDPDVAQLLRLLLQKSGLLADVASTAAEARRRFAERSYDAVTLDLLLPDDDGLVLLREFQEQAPHLPVVVVSVEANDRQRTLEGAALPLVDWLNKPFSTDRLVAAVRHALRSVAAPRILHVEDDVDCAAVTAELLAGVGEVVRADTLATARARLSAEPFDLLLLDLGLPDGDGLALLDDPLPHPLPPAVIYSAREADTRRAERVLHTVVKGRIDETKLLRLVQDAVRSRRADQAA